MSITAIDIAKMIDHSLLRPELTVQDVIDGCKLAACARGERSGGVRA